MRQYLDLPLILAALLFVSSVHANDRSADEAFIVDHVTVTKIDNNEMARQLEGHLWVKSLSDIDLGEIIAIGEKLIAFGTKVWKIIENGKPSVTTALAKPISVIPVQEGEGVSFLDMEGWAAPQVSTYRFEAKNIYGRVLASFDYTLAFQPEGSYLGTGQYVTGLQVIASSVHVKWGVTFNASSELMTISNRGTEDDPIAGATLKVDYSVSTVLSELRKTAVFHVAGDGEVVAY